MHASTLDLISFVKQYDVKYVLCSFSGGRDSLVATHVAHSQLRSLDIPIEVVFIDTTVGLPLVKEYVKKICNKLCWRLTILEPNPSFWDLALKWGMPTPKRRWCCRILKLRPMLEYAAGLGKDVVAYITGLRRSESKRRSKMKGFFERTHRGVKIYSFDPIIDWTDEDVETYIKVHELPLNPLYEIIGFSGECFCGVFTKVRHLIMLAQHFPDFIEKFRELEEGWKNGKFAEKNYKPFYADGMKLSVDDLFKIAKKTT